MEDDRKPFFRFNPYAYLPGRSFEASDDACDICARPMVWKYTGGVYAVEEPQVCASCIADGTLEARLGAENFALHDTDLDGAAPELESELMHRTPGVQCFNPFDWPVIDGRPLVFLHHGEDQTDLWNKAEVRSAIRAAFDEIGWDDEPTNRTGPPGPYVLLFKDLESEHYRARIDLD